MLHTHLVKGSDDRLFEEAPYPFESVSVDISPTNYSVE